MTLLRFDRLLVSRFFTVALGLFVAFLVSCSSDEKLSGSPEQLFAGAQEYEKAERYDEAIKRYQEIKNKFPYSKVAVEAELAIADAHFKDEAFAEAQASYQVFKDLHPKHARADYVTFQIGLSAYQQLPTTIDRDLTIAKAAITSFDEVIVRFPGSDHIAEARQKKADCLHKLAAKEEYIADFYFKQEVYTSALPRYEGLYRDYPSIGFDEKALSRGAISAKRAGDLDKARYFLAELKKVQPNSAQISGVEKELP